ncbi:MAG: phytanoyl-CoA dioxygenase family protein [Proteobacteria bacterium]|nr:phytanoyl-CoA dioxygenase family protein [Pseudomonadota bacterium]MBI3499657.1 phytanoyl-CoA dioxygenase family protein [Pseudomonadota bacterium]
MGKLLSDQQVQGYHRNGFIAPVPVLSAAEAAQFLSRFEAYAGSREKRRGSAYDDEEGREFLRQPHRRARWAYELVNHPRVLDAIEDILGPDVMVWDAKLFPKPPHSLSYVGWHQDGTYSTAAPREHKVTAWIALTDATPENGAMQAIPGSHNWGQLEHVQSIDDHNLLRYGQSISTPFDASTAVDLSLQAGEMSMHHNMLIHGSPPNPSPTSRIGLSVNYISPDVIDKPDPERRVILARGNDRFGHFQLFDWPEGRRA